MTISSSMSVNPRDGDQSIVFITGVSRIRSGDESLAFLREGDNGRLAAHGVFKKKSHTAMAVWRRSIGWN